MLRLTFLGTASARPTVRRNVSSLAVKREGDFHLFDCGEGTQRQMMRFGVGFSLRRIFVTHMHADHYLGVTGLLRTLSLQGRREILHLHGPPGSAAVLERLVTLGGDRLLFPVEIEEVGAGEAVRLGEYRVEAFATRHKGSSVGYALVEDERPGRFDPGRAAELGVPEGPLFGRLHAGETVETPDGREIRPDQVVGPPRPGRTLVYTGDTTATKTVGRAAAGADLLVHEATFGEEEAERARQTAHSTARQAARVARRAGARALVLTHFSARYSELAWRLEREAETDFPDVVAAEDGMTLRVPYRDQEAGIEVERAGGAG